MEVSRQIVWRINDLTRRAVSWPCNWPCEVLMGGGEWIVGGLRMVWLDNRPANARRPWILGLDWVPGEGPEEPVNWWRHSTVWPVKAPEQARPSHHAAGELGASSTVISLLDSPACIWSAWSCPSYPPCLSATPSPSPLPGHRVPVREDILT